MCNSCTYHAEAEVNQVPPRFLDSPCGCADLCCNSDSQKCIVVDNVEHIAMNKELEVLMEAPYHSGMNR